MVDDPRLSFQQKALEAQINKDFGEYIVREEFVDGKLVYEFRNGTTRLLVDVDGNRTYEDI